ncbi:predicted protein [Lichtheimia corymbifera JMRC:FSU:9682]|uniref:Uncharacterized protein n=2 Tax=Lichtheimia TaxID=688353 RepID=A0A068RZY0_9FUNG|nr:uncharacterized protein O0I10_000767 [Lichtheimia ornata]KAJ8663525.1 hypothetical protein O0I10_000767 [Lichtheimia ornata]CDH55539.1 predicted protein [Lichtheimia corymbifera JMRC:FSU:9682]
MFPRHAVTACSRRAYTTATNNATAAAKPKRKVGATRGGILGFLVGAGVCVAFSEQFIQQEFIESTRQLAKSVDELHASTEKVREYADIVERLDRDYTQLRSSVINAKDLDKLKRDLYKVHDQISHEHVLLKARVGEIELNKQ